MYAIQMHFFRWDNDPYIIIFNESMSASTCSVSVVCVQNVYPRYLMAMADASCK